MAENSEKINESLHKLEDIVGWFEHQEDVDVEEGLKKVKEGALLVKDLKAKLKKVENEFEEIKKTIDSENENTNF